MVAQIEDLSQQAQMAAAEKFKAPPEQPTVTGEPPSATVQPLHESDEEEVRAFSYAVQHVQCIVTAGDE